MPVNKEIIIRVAIGLVLFVVFAKIVGPILFDILKRQIPGAYQPDNDIDTMIKRQKQRMRSQHGLIGNDSESSDLKKSVDVAPLSSPVVKSQNIETLFKESQWGGGDFIKSIQSEITKNYSYTLTESKVNAFILLTEKRNYLKYLSTENQNNNEAIKLYLSLLMLFLILIEEMRNREFYLLENVARKCNISSQEFSLALQLKILYALTTKRNIKDERLFESGLTLHQYSEDSMKDAMDLILKKEANIWAKGHALFIEELSMHLTFASVLVPTPKIQNKKDIATAYIILKSNPEMDFEEIKKNYKKMALLKHPDKIGQMNLPKFLEKKALTQFTHIQEVFDLIASVRKK